MDALEVCNRLDASDREEIVKRFTTINRHWRGAQAADIIDTLEDHDSNLPEVEAAWDSFPEMRKPGFGFAVRALLWSGKDVTEDNLRPLLTEGASHAV